MRESKELSSLTATRRRTAVLSIAVFFLAALFADSGCGIKKTVKIRVPQAILQAKTASFDELLGIIRNYYDKIDRLSTDPTGMELTFTSSRKISEGELEKYKSLRGYILLRRPDSVRFVLLVPLMQSTLFDVLSVGDKLSMLYARGHRFYEASNSAKELYGIDPSTSKEFQVPPIRGPHIFEAIFPQGIVLDAPGALLDVIEETDAQASYYVLSMHREDKSQNGMPHRIHTLRKIYIERSGLTIARQKVFDEEGRIVSDITYSDEIRIEEFSLPRQIHIDRPQDGYTLDLKIRKWSINPDLPDEAFMLSPGPEDQIIPLTVKATRNDPK